MEKLSLILWESKVMEKLRQILQQNMVRVMEK